ncbi:uncharacterized protein [Diadema antillarum]|uniref:uncharacterized protein n=1 Tax=Diadema antillarum TaxID=105358 RepID=UPI003A89C06C
MLRVILFVFASGLVMQAPVTQHLFLNMACKRLDYTDDVCSDLSKHPDAEDAVQSEASRIMIWDSVFADIPGAVSALILGAQSDKVGRKPIMLIPVVGLTLLVFIRLLGSLLQKASMVFLFTSSLVGGLSGGFGTFTTALTNFVTDSTPEEHRTERLGKIMPFISLGVIAGYTLSGFLTQTFGVTAVYLIDFLMMISVVNLVVFHLEEPSRVAEESSADDGRIKDKPIGMVASARENLVAGVRVFTSQKSRNAKLQLAVLTFIRMVGMAIVIGAFMSLGTFLHTLAVPITSFVLNNIYSASVQTRPGLVFLVIAVAYAGIFSALTYVVMFTLDRQAKDEKKTE